MIRPFDLRDVALVAQLESQGVPLNAELALTQKPRPLQSALASFFSWHSRGVRTYVCRGALLNQTEKSEGLVQIKPRRGTARGYVTFVAPTLATGAGVDETWIQLLAYAGQEAAGLGLHHLIAEAPEDGDEVEVLRRAGFAVYLRQDILRLHPARRPQVHGDGLRRCEEIDVWPVQQLYFNTAPRLAHLAEGLPQVGQPRARGYVYYEKDELAAYVEARRGSHGAWFGLLVHPDAEARAAHILSEALAGLGETWDRPIFCGVRRYQEWLRRPLESLGFEPYAASVLMVKHLVAPIAAEPEPALAHALEVRAKVTQP
ncbi:MAG TPA: hypothetical protein VJG32_22915 [Anaerolineae bacterium]|nr:hypothetical protein [Anaerolineae bacterium]